MGLVRLGEGGKGRRGLGGGMGLMGGVGMLCWRGEDRHARFAATY